MRKLLLLLIGIVVISAKSTASGFYILQRYIEPAHPSTDDSVKVVFYLYSSNQPCNNLNQSVVINDTNIIIKRCKMTGAFDAGCWEYDSVNLGKLPLGSYHLSYFLNHVTWNNPNDSSCNAFTQPVDTAYLDFTVSFTNNMRDLYKTEFDFNLYPNPITNQLIITTKAIHNAVATILTMTGCQVMQTTLGNQSKNEIDISQLSVGLYYLSLQDDKGRVVRRFVKE